MEHWLIRNKSLYEQGHATVSKSHTIQQSIEYAYMAAPQHTRPRRIKYALKWIPPAPNIYKVNTDGAHSLTSNMDGIGGVIRNHLGDWIVGFLGNIPQSTSISVELQALIQGLQLASTKSNTTASGNRCKGGNHYAS